MSQLVSHAGVDGVRPGPSFFSGNMYESGPHGMLRSNHCHALTAPSVSRRAHRSPPGPWRNTQLRCRRLHCVSVLPRGPIAGVYSPHREPPRPDLRVLRRVFNVRRAQSGQTYDELAESTGLSRRTLLNIGTGTYFGDLETWLILARVWNVSLDEIFSPVWGESPPE